jgi:hypothetical protein
MLPAHHAPLSHHLRTSSETREPTLLPTLRSLHCYSLLTMLTARLDDVRYLIFSLLLVPERLLYSDLDPISHVELVDGQTPHLNPMISLTFPALRELLQRRQPNEHVRECLGSHAACHSTRPPFPLFCGGRRRVKQCLVVRRCQGRCKKGYGRRALRRLFHKKRATSESPPHLRKKYTGDEHSPNGRPLVLAITITIGLCSVVFGLVRTMAPGRSLTNSRWSIMCAALFARDTFRTNARSPHPRTIDAHRAVPSTSTLRVTCIHGLESAWTRDVSIRTDL